MNKPKTIIFTGGGTSGHVIPNLVLIEKFKHKSWNIHYIGTKKGIEKDLLSKIGVSYYSIMSGKLRRYFSYKNFFDPIKVAIGIIQSIKHLLYLKPDIIFSKGGFVSFPVVIAGWILNIPVIIHESDLTLGLTNKLCLFFSQKICISFLETIENINFMKKKIVLTGIPLRKDLFKGNANYGKNICNFTIEKKVLLVLGGSLGSNIINILIRRLLPIILKNFNVIHICGSDKIDNELNYIGYKQFSYLNDDFHHILAASDLVISRAGANTIYELISLKKPNILLPLSSKASRGDQIINAEYCFNNGYSEIIYNDNLNDQVLIKKIELVEKKSIEMINNMNKFNSLKSTNLIFYLINDVIKCN